MIGKKLIYVGLFIFAIVSMASGQHSSMANMVPADTIAKAIAVLNPASGSQVHGTVIFTKEDNGIRVVALIAGLTPGKHGFHIHEFGDCSAPDASSAGGHFNPGHMPHGGPNDKEHHVGDMGNINADSSGVAHLDYTDNSITLSGSNSIIGHSVVVHASPDDFKTQPSGNSGTRVACGVIGIAK
jgi:Cu-Zn family superoxide dismutase